MNPSRLQAEAEPYTPLATRYAGLPPTGPPFPPPPLPSFFAPMAPFVYLAPPPPTLAGFLGGVQGCWDAPMAPGGVGMQGAGAFPHPACLPLMPVPHGAIAMPPAPPCVTAGAMPQGSGKGNGKQPPPRSERAGRSPCARPRPRLVVPPRMRPAASPRAPAASRGAKAADAGGDGAAKEEPANEPSPRSVLVTQSPPISPTTSLPSAFPLPCLSPAPAAAAPRTEPLLASAELGTVSPPVSAPKRMKPRRLRRAPRVVRRSVQKPRQLFDPASNHTSLMIRHIPNDFTKERLMAIIDQHCFIENEKIATGGIRSEYDFLYLPIDFSTLANKGYAFVNMTSPDAARRLWEHLRGHRWEVRRCGKTCAVDDGAIQGLPKLVDHFSGSVFPCDTEEFLPARFDPPRDGTRPFEGVVHVVGRLARRL